MNISQGLPAWQKVKGCVNRPPRIHSRIHQVPSQYPPALNGYRLSLNPLGLGWGKALMDFITHGKSFFKKRI